MSMILALFQLETRRCPPLQQSYGEVLQELFVVTLVVAGDILSCCLCEKEVYQKFPRLGAGCGTIVNSFHCPRSRDLLVLTGNPSLELGDVGAEYRILEDGVFELDGEMKDD